MALTAYNATHGYLDAILRGYRSAILDQAQYTSLCECKVVDDMKVHLLTTDYVTVLQDEPSPLSTNTLSQRLTARMVEEFRHLRDQAIEPLATFLDYITYSYMIDNIILILTETHHEGGDAAELLERCHPLGLFEGIGSLCVAQSPAELYNMCLVNTPLAKYFLSCLTMEDLDEIHIEIIRNMLYKEYLKDFLKFSRSLGGETAEVMGNLLRFEADCRSISITCNSWDTELSKDDRTKLYPNFGDLWPEGTERLMHADDMAGVSNAVESFDTYRNIISDLTYNPSKSLEDCFYENQVELCKEAFEHYFQFGVYYAYFKLKEQEIRNILWIAACIEHNQRARITQFVSIF
eukprot:gnl/Trimastix_PCT/1946.p1 GENE.gnl/Trimastix_PCT/1946~~gnl/Trimastix_PCT/1946.p1  ORF type:complete len:349 (+),score=120.05 gnl/Trimastix_PCT/1946:52-1098(+)